MITFESKGDFSKATSYLLKLSKNEKLRRLEAYGQMGVQALQDATPKDTGETAKAWTYEIYQTSKGIRISWHNSNVNKGVPIAILIQYGHGTGTGGWVEGRDYINPALRPIFDKISADLWKEMTEV